MSLRHASTIAAAAAAAAMLLPAAALRAQAADPNAPAPLPHVSLHPNDPQQQGPTLPPVKPSTPAPDQPAPDSATPPAPLTSAVPESPAAAPQTAAAPLQPAAPQKAVKPTKKGKEEYTGPTEIVTLPPTPMLDEEGKQRLDPEGKPMFNPPVKQQRDKKGHPLFDASGKPIFQTATELGYDEHGKHLKAEKVKPPKMTPVSISRGTFTVDGVIAKAELNYEIADLHFIYFFVPGMGVTIVSNHEFPGAKAQQNAFNDNNLTVKVDDRTLQLTSDKRLLDKKPEPAYVAVDRNYQLASRYPIVGYGTLYKPPYQWPGSHENGEIKAIVAPPPIPKNLQPVLLLSPCPKGQMRMPAPKVQPGQQAPPQPCVPIPQAQAKPAAPKAAAPPAAAPTPAPPTP